MGRSFSRGVRRLGAASRAGRGARLDAAAFKRGSSKSANIEKAGVGLHDNKQGLQMTIASCSRALGLALAIGAITTSAQANLVDVGDVGVYFNPGAFSQFGPNGQDSGMIDNVGGIANGIQWQPGLVASAASFSGYSDFSVLNIRLDGGFLPETGKNITGYTVTIKGAVSAQGTGRARLDVDANDPHDVSDMSWADMGSSTTPFSWTHTFAMSDWQPVLHVNATVGANYISNCAYGFFGSCTYQQGTASLQIASILLRANLSAAIPAVPEADLAWMALAGMALVAARGRRLAS
jgi:hypothetical protein